MASVRGILNIQSLNELTYENTSRTPHTFSAEQRSQGGTFAAAVHTRILHPASHSVAHRASSIVEGKTGVLLRSEAPNRAPVRHPPQEAAHAPSQPVVMLIR